MKGKDERYPDYPLFKGLQRPLEFMGIQGRYIYWAAGVAGGAIVGFIIAYCLVGFVAGLVVLVAVVSTVLRLSCSNSGKGCIPRKTVAECISTPTRRNCEKKRKNHHGQRVVLLNVERGPAA